MRTTTVDGHLYVSVADLANNLVNVADRSAEVAVLMPAGPEQTALANQAQALVEVGKILADMLDRSA